MRQLANTLMGKLGLECRLAQELYFFEGKIIKTVSDRNLGLFFTKNAVSGIY